MRKALAVSTDSSGGYLVPAEISRDVLMGLRARSAVMQMGPTIVPLKKSLDVVSLSTGASAVYLAENAPIPVSEQTFVQSALLTPRELAALVPVSDRLLRDADDNPSVEEIVRRDLAEVLALRADLAFLRGTGTGREPRGIRNTPGLTPAPSLGANGGQPAFDDLKEVVAALRNVNAPFSRPGWVFHPRTIGTLERFKDADGHYLAETGLLTFDVTGGGGSLLGFPFRTTTQIPINLSIGSSSDCSEIYFSSDWDEVWIGEEDTLRIEVSGEATYWTGTGWVSAFQSRQHLFRATLVHDIGLRRPQLFTVMTGVRQ
jgi:HK97 family phage major capsid protein